MGRLKWYKRDPRAALAGMMELTLEERGAYNTVLDLIYIHDGAIADSSGQIAAWLNVDVRVWNRLRGRLIELGKLYKNGETLRNERADLETDAAQHRLLSASQAGIASAISRGYGPSKTNKLPRAPVKRSFELTTSTKITSSFLTAEEPKVIVNGKDVEPTPELLEIVAKQNGKRGIESKPASLASALPTGALTRPASKEQKPINGKPVSQVTKNELEAIFAAKRPATIAVAPADPIEEKEIPFE